MKFSRKFESKQEQEEYIRKSILIWGAVPVDIDWAIESPVYKQIE